MVSNLAITAYCIDSIRYWTISRVLDTSKFSVIYAIYIGIGRYLNPFLEVINRSAQVFQFVTQFYFLVFADRAFLSSLHLC